MIRSTVALIFLSYTVVLAGDKVAAQCCKPKDTCGGPGHAAHGVPCAAPADPSGTAQDGAGGGDAKEAPKPRKPEKSTVLSAYFKVWKSLAKDEVKGIPEAKKELASGLEALSKNAPKGLSPKNKDQRSKVLEAALAAASKLDGSDLKKARQTFGPLSAELRKFVEAYPAEADAYIVYCDMAKKSWLQDSSKVLNPYYGSSMSDCGKVLRKPKTSPPEDASKGKEKEPDGKPSGHEHGGHSGDHKH